MFEKTKMKDDPSEKIGILRKERKQCCLGCPKRWMLVLLGFFGFFNANAMKVNLSVAMVAMVRKQQPDNDTHETIECFDLLKPELNGSSSSFTSDGDFDWDPSTQSLILGSFFYGFVITQIPSGVFAEKYGAKWLFGSGIFLTSVLTLLTPSAAFWGVWPLVIVRAIEGLGEGVIYPTNNVLVGRWAPKNERTRMVTVIYTGNTLGSVLSFALTGIISDTLGWPFAFYIFGILGIIWALFWMFLVYETPEIHPCITEKEIEHIRQGQESSGLFKVSAVPWKNILKSRHVWGLLITHIGHDWGYYTLLTELPTYLAEILHFDIKKNGVLNALPHLMHIFSALFASFIADSLRTSGRFRITTIRKWFNSLAFFTSALCIGLVSFLGCRPTAIVILFVVSSGFNGLCMAGFRVTHVDMSPEFAGTLLGITNCIANLSGFLAPAYVGFITQSGHTLKNWKIVFLTTSAVYIVTGLVYDFFCTAELQPWGAARPSGRRSVDEHGDNIKTDIIDNSKKEQTNQTRF